MRQFFGVTNRGNADQSAVVNDGQGAVSPLEHVIENEVMHAEIWRRHHWRRVHDARNRYATERLTLHLLVACGFSRIVQKPANKRRPQPAEEVAAEQTDEAPED